MPHFAQLEFRYILTKHVTVQPKQQVKRQIFVGISQAHTKCMTTPKIAQR